MTLSVSRPVAVAGAAMAVLALAACSSSSDSGSASPASSTSSEAPASTAASSGAADSPAAAAAAIVDGLTGPIQWQEPPALSTPIDVKDKTIWWIPIGDAVPVIHGFYEGFTQAVEAAGGTVKLCDGKFNPSDIGACMTSAADQGADAVVTAFVDYAMLPTAFDALTAKGIPVLVAGVPSSGGKTNSAELAFYDPSERVHAMYETLSAAAIAATDGQTNGLWLRLLDSSLTTESADAGVAKYKELCPQCPLATVDYTTANADKITSAVSAALVANPDVNAIMVPVDSFIPSVQQAVKTAGISDQVAIVSTGGDLANMQSVQAGTQAGDLGTPVINMGWTYANALFQLLVGDEVLPQTGLQNRYFTQENTADLTLTPEAYLSNQWYGDDSYEAAYLKAWGVS